MYHIVYAWLFSNIGEVKIINFIYNFFLILHFGNSLVSSCD